MRIYVDADIIIWHLRGNAKATKFLRKIKSDPAYELWIGAMQRAEVVFFMRPEEEQDILLFLSHFKTAPMDQEIVDDGAVLFRQWVKSHGVGINDALLAAMCQKTGGKIVTLNKKHFPFKDIIVEKAWH